MIKLENVTFRYPKAIANALEKASLEIPQGSFFTLLGPNGAGKTTLLRLICGRFGLHQGSFSKGACLSGRILVDDSCCDSRSTAKANFLDPKSYGVLLENPGIYPKLSIEEYLSYFAAFYGNGEGACLPCGKLRERAEHLARLLEIPALNSRMSTLSLGNRQKVQIVRALIHNPKILILDEPVANLDPNARESVWKLIADWRREKGGTAIVCSHILAEMESEATHYAVIDKGRILQCGELKSPESQKSDSLKVYTEFFIELTNPASRDQVCKALEASGLNGLVKTRESSLAHIYRNLVK